MLGFGGFELVFFLLGRCRCGGRCFGLTGLCLYVRGEGNEDYSICHLKFSEFYIEGEQF